MAECHARGLQSEQIVALSHPMRTAAHELADHKAGGNLDEKVRRLRAALVSWPAIARLLKIEHGIEVSDETLRRWYPEQPAGDAA